MLPVGPKFFGSPLYMREDPEWPNVVLAMHMDADPYWANVVLAMPMDGANNGTTFTDLKGKAVTPTGAVTKTTNKAFGTASAYFNGSSYCDTPASTDFDFGTGDFTVECWIYLDGNSSANPNGYFGGGVFGTQSLAGTYWGLYVSGSNVTPPGTGTGLAFETALSGVTAFRSTGFTVPQYRWNHIAVCRASGSLMFFCNGVMYSGGTITQAINSGGSGFTVGRQSGDPSWSRPFSGYIDGLRITKGVARYTTHFELPMYQFPQGTSFIDEKNHAVTVSGNAVLSSAQSVSGGYSAYFDGSGDYLSIPNSTDWDFGAGDFTIEGRFFSVGTTALSQNIICRWSNLYGDGWSWQVTIASDLSAITFGTNGSYDVVLNQAMAVNTWYHFAISRRGSVMYGFINGVLKYSGAFTKTIYSTVNPVNVTIGAATSPSTWFMNGYIDDLRITKGVGRYISNFNPPIRFSSHTTTDPYFSSVVLGLHCNGAVGSTNIIDVKGKVVTAVGNTQLSATQSRFGPTACYFDGSGDYLTVPDSADWDFAAGNFTVETWIFFTNTVSGPQHIIGQWGNNTDNAWHIGIGATNQIFYEVTPTGAYQPANSITTSTQLAPNTWHHVAFVRNGNVFTCYTNGTASGTHTAAITLYNSPQVLNLGIGALGAQVYVGYIDDVRITKGIARYTANFTPPRAPFPNW